MKNLYFNGKLEKQKLNKVVQKLVTPAKKYSEFVENIFKIIKYLIENETDASIKLDKGLLLDSNFKIIYGYLKKINEFRKNNKGLETCDESSMKTFNEILNSVKNYIFILMTPIHTIIYWKTT